ncbi:glycine betaine ABC transporter substrate-binding protein [Virgibacillus sp. W0181]|uniref:glycine betaine ABC transporter substrate-binding protein n=1 Tax=Virgibacillus sp. W0181 TaxID=3391581 RepID=UPI003F488069
MKKAFKVTYSKTVCFVALIALLLVVSACGDSSSNSENGNENAGTNNEEVNDEANSDEVDYSEAVNYSITGIEPGAGIMLATEDAMEDYDNLNGWELEASSSGAMATALDSAINNEEPIVVTGWSPHWKFAKYDLHYLEDTKNSYGDPQNIETIVRKGLKEDMPNAYKVLDQFFWTSEDLDNVMLEISDGGDPAEVAADWVAENEDKVAEWIDGAEEVDGKEIELSYVEWDTEIGSTNVMKKVLEDLGFDVTITPLDMAVMWQSVADGETDGMIAAWLPVSQGELFEEHQDNIENLGANLEGVKIGLVVPDYMDIDSIDDLKPKE